MLEARIDSDHAESMLLDLRSRISNPRPVLKQFHTYMLRQTGQTFRRLGRIAFGGTKSFRDVTWNGFSPLYVRKDGTRIPPWGGVPKVRGKGRVKGRLRPSGQRVTRQSQLLRDTGRLATEAGTSVRWKRDGTILEMTTKNVAYAQEQQDRHPFLFFQIPQDLNVAVRIAKDHIDGVSLHKSH